MIPMLALGIVGIAYGLLAHNVGEIYIGVVLIGLVLLVLVEEHERKLVRRKNRASENLDALHRLRIGLAQIMEEDDAA